VELIWDGIREAFDILRSGDFSIWEIALRSLLVSGSATAISLVIGITVGAMLAFNEFRGRNLAFALVNTGMGLPPVVVGLLVAIFLWRSGPLGGLNLIYTPGAMVVRVRPWAIIPLLRIEPVSRDSPLHRQDPFRCRASPSAR